MRRYPVCMLAQCDFFLKQAFKGQSRVGDIQ